MYKQSSGLFKAAHLLLRYLYRRVNAVQALLFQWFTGMLRPKETGVRLLRQAQEIPRSNGSKFYPTLPFRVGIVADPFQFAAFRNCCNLCFLTPDTPDETLCQLDFALFLSTWHGLSDEWTGNMVPGSEKKREFVDLMCRCRDHGLKTAFYSKEDPGNLQWFIDFAPYADYVFTSATECIETYRRRCGHDRVYQLSFGANPLLYNPIGMDRYYNRRTAMFAGSWTKKYPNRIRDQKNLFRWIREAGLRLLIFDRNDRLKIYRYQYPLRYQSSVIPDVQYDVLPGLFKQFIWLLNFNSEVESESMLSLRVYDILACGGVALSNWSRSLEKLLPEARVIRSREDLGVLLKMDAEELDTLRLRGIRRVMSGNTVFDRFSRILDCCEIPGGFPVHTILVVADPAVQDMEALKAMFDAQTYPHRRFAFADEAERILSEEPVSMLALWKDGRTYRPHYLEDMINGFKYTSCDFIAKPSIYLGEERVVEQRYEFTGMIPDKYATVFWAETISLPELLRLPASNAVRSNGYVSDQLNYEIPQ